jgi:multidrug efflux pump subunit AcrB
MEDGLMRIFASERIAGMMRKLGMEHGEAIEHPWVTRSIENAQRKVEGRNFDVRKQLLEYDDVANDQRKVIYEQRNALMETVNISDYIVDTREEVRIELLDLDEVSTVTIEYIRPYEISIEVSEFTLRQYGLTMSEVSQAIKNSSIDMPGGTIKSEGGDILLRTKGQVYTGQEFGALVLRTFPDGTRLTLDDVANINDGFVESDRYGRFNGEPTATLQVVAGGQQNEIETAKAVKAYIAEKEKALPPGISLDIWIDLPKYLEGSLNRMQNNMITGAILVFVVLSLFLRMKVAFWVIVGLPITFLGTLWLMPTCIFFQIVCDNEAGAKTHVLHCRCMWHSARGSNRGA